MQTCVTPLLLFHYGSPSLYNALKYQDTFPDLLAMLVKLVLDIICPAKSSIYLTEISILVD